MALTTPRGDIAATVTLATPTTPASGLDSYTRYTEYGQPTTPQPQTTTGAAGNGYGWLGAKQRTTTTIGLLLMGARLYNPTTGHFTSIDPVFGGNDTPYTYPNDPINKQDVTGEETSFWEKARSTAKSFGRWYSTSRTGKALSFACGFVRFSIVGGLCTIADTVANVANHGWKRGLAQSATNLVGGKFINGGSRAVYNLVKRRHGDLAYRLGSRAESWGVYRWGSRKNAAYRRTTKLALSAYRGGANGALGGLSDRWARR